MIYKEEFKMGIKDMGKELKIKNKTLLEFLENIASYHSDFVGNGASSTTEEKEFWVLLEWRVQIIKRPKYSEKLTISTWGRDMQRFYIYRDFEVYNEKNELCVIATSKWTRVNKNTGKLARLDENIIHKYKPEEKNVFNEKTIQKIKIPEKNISEITYKVIRRDIDINGHMHNLCYLDLAYEALPQKIYEEEIFNNIRITYKKEMKLGDTVKCKYTKQEEKNIIVIKSEDENIIHSIIEIY